VVANGPKRIVVQVKSDDISGWRTALRNMGNLVRDDLSSTPHGPYTGCGQWASRPLPAGDLTEAPKLARMTKVGVTASVCSNSLQRFDHDATDHAAGVETVPSGVTEVIRAQEREDAYLKLP
jgi:intracellular sulfur oxidation DsrE/DsrF family protein